MTTSHTITQIVNDIMLLLRLPGSHYKSVKMKDGEYMKIRVSDHSANCQNNGSQQTISFISQRTAVKRLNWPMAAEFLIPNIEEPMTDTYEWIEDILADYEIAIQ